MRPSDVGQRPHLVLIPLVFVAFVAGWEAIVRAWRVPDYLLPAPSAVARALGTGLTNRVYLEHAWITVTEALLVIEDVTVSVAVTLCVPAVFSVTEKVPAPLVNVESAGRTACASLLVKCAVPE